MKLLRWFCFMLALIPAPAALCQKRQKVDVLYMKNGDRITCEIKKMENGYLTVKMPYTKGDVTLDWNEVQKLESPQLFTIETDQGDFHTGTIRADAAKNDAIEVDRKLSVPQPHVVEIRQLGRSWKNQISFALDLGYSFTQASAQTQSTLSTSFKHLTARRELAVSLDSLLSTQKNAEDTRRERADVSWATRLGQSRWYVGALGEFLSSSEQQLDVRSTVGGALSRRVINTNRNRLTVLGGLVFTDERYAQTQTNQRHFRSLESTFGLQYSTFRFDSTELSTELATYPSLTDPGRVRISLRSDYYLKLPHDFYWRVGVYENFDSRPPSQTTKNDFGTTVAVGWSFP